MSSEWVQFWAIVAATAIPIAIHLKPGRGWGATITGATISSVLLLVLGAVNIRHLDDFWFIGFSLGWFFCFAIACLVRFVFFLIRRPK